MCANPLHLTPLQERTGALARTARGLQLGKALNANKKAAGQ
jgi:hypothetical protein